MFGAIICVAIRGIILVGGVEEVYRRANEGNRFQFWNMDPDPTIRHSFWTLAIGGIFIYTSLYGVNQTQVQRLLTVKSLKKAQLALVISWPITSLLSLVTSATGIIMYAYFQGCDPIRNKQIESADQLLPYFMMKVIGSYPGLPGLFVAGIFSGALSSVSSFVNSLAAVTLEDFIKPLKAKNPMSESAENFVTKLLALFFGLLCLALTYLAEQMSGILQASLTIFGVVGGPLLGLFTLGMCTRTCSAKAALFSFLFSLLIGFWIGFGALSSGIKPTVLHLPIETCGMRNISKLKIPEMHLSESSLLASEPVVTSITHVGYSNEWKREGIEESDRSHEKSSLVLREAGKKDGTRKMTTNTFERLPLELNNDISKADQEADRDESSRGDDGHGEAEISAASVHSQSMAQIDHGEGRMLDNSTSPEGVFYLYRMSYMYLAGFTCIIEVILGLILSLLFWPNSNDIKSHLISPLFGGSSPSNQAESTQCADCGALLGEHSIRHCSRCSPCESGDGEDICGTGDLKMLPIKKK